MCLGPQEGAGCDHSPACLGSRAGSQGSQDEEALLVKMSAGLMGSPAPILSPHSFLLPVCQYCIGFELECPRNTFIRQIAHFIKEALGSACKAGRSPTTQNQRLWLAREGFKGRRSGSLSVTESLLQPLLQVVLASLTTDDAERRPFRGSH